jgi:hypothetical protein
LSDTYPNCYGVEKEGGIGKGMTIGWRNKRDGKEMHEKEWKKIMVPKFTQ